MESTKIHAFWNSGIHLCTDPIRCHGQQQIRSCLKSDSRIEWVLVLVVLHYGLHGYRPLDNTATMAGYLATYHTDFSPDLHSVLCILNLEEIKGTYLEPRFWEDPLPPLEHPLESLPLQASSVWKHERQIHYQQTDLVD